MNLIRLIFFIPIALIVGNIPYEFFSRYIDSGIYINPSSNDGFDNAVLNFLTSLQWFLTFLVAAILKPTFFTKKYFKFFLWICFGMFFIVNISYFSSITGDYDNSEIFGSFWNIVWPPSLATIFATNSKFFNKILDNENPDLW